MQALAFHCSKTLEHPKPETLTLLAKEHFGDVVLSASVQI